jgi:hypothetical protein
MPNHGSPNNPHNLPGMSGYNPNLRSGQNRGRTPRQNIQNIQRARRTRRRQPSAARPSRRTQQRLQRSSPVMRRSRSGAPTGRSVSRRQSSSVRRQIRPTVSRYYLNGIPYNGNVLNVNGDFYTTKSGVMEGSSKPLTIGKP